MARAADAPGMRTVGITTKCDALQEGDEPGCVIPSPTGFLANRCNVLKIAQNSVERLNHGWFALKNRSTKEILEGVTTGQRHVNEKNFFETKLWNQLPKDLVGIAPLKGFLGKLLYNHIRNRINKPYALSG
jgi:hypothetical protein